MIFYLAPFFSCNGCFEDVLVRIRKPSLQVKGRLNISINSVMHSTLLFFGSDIAVGTNDLYNAVRKGCIYRYNLPHLNIAKLRLFVIKLQQT